MTPSKISGLNLGSIALAVLFAVVPLVFYTPMADVFLLDKTIWALTALLFLLAGFRSGEWEAVGIQLFSVGRRVSPPGCF